MVAGGVDVERLAAEVDDRHVDRELVVADVVLVGEAQLPIVVAAPAADVAALEKGASDVDAAVDLDRLATVCGDKTSVGVTAKVDGQRAFADGGRSGGAGRHALW